MHREVQRALKILSDLLEHLRAATLAEDTRQMGTLATEAMALADAALNVLKTGAGEHADEYGRIVNVELVEAGTAALNRSWESAEKVALASSLAEMRERVLDFKTYADYADAYLQASVGWDAASN